jgi:hypothetical protein
VSPFRKRSLSSSIFFNDEKNAQQLVSGRKIIADKSPSNIELALSSPLKPSILPPPDGSKKRQFNERKSSDI